MSIENAVHCMYKAHVSYSAIMVPVMKKLNVGSRHSCLS